MNPSSTIKSDLKEHIRQRYNDKHPQFAMLGQCDDIRRILFAQNYIVVRDSLIDLFVDPMNAELVEKKYEDALLFAESTLYNHLAAIMITVQPMIKEN